MEMTRFNIFMDQAVEVVEWSLSNMKGSEIIVPKLKSFLNEICERFSIKTPLSQTLLHSYHLRCLSLYQYF